MTVDENGVQHAETVAEFVALYGESLCLAWLRTEEVRFHKRRKPRAKGPSKAALNRLLQGLTEEELTALKA